MEHLRGYDAWKTRVPDVPSGGVRDRDALKHTAMLWWRSYRFAKRHDFLNEWLETQRGIPLFADFVAEADRMKEHQ